MKQEFQKLYLLISNNKIVGIFLEEYLSPMLEREVRLQNLSALYELKEVPKEEWSKFSRKVI